MTPRTLVSATQLHALAGRDDVLVVDCRFDLADPARGARDHATAHVPGAVHADLDRDLSDLSRRGLGRHPLPDAAAFSALLGRWGVTPQTTVIAYDDAAGALAAARLWWLLRLAGHERAAVLDGGFGAWTQAGLPLDRDTAARAATQVDVTFDARDIVGSAQIEAMDDAVFLLDARAAPRFRGEVEPIDPVAGHIPGAHNRPFTDNLQEGRFKPAPVLRKEFLTLLGAHAPTAVVHMCGSGVTACHNLLAMEHAALGGSRIYAPSWSGWITEPSRAVATGAD
jgi:thiosulfate/3-mercaptopyruvate sulfurtransferase